MTQDLENPRKVSAPSLIELKIITFTNSKKAWLRIAIKFIIEMKCAYCTKETNNPKFCSRSCSASYTNKRVPKRKRKTVCKKEDCKKITKSYRHTLCNFHWDEYMKFRGDNLKNKTIGEYQKRNSLKGKHPSWKNTHIRQLCRSWLKDLIIKPCAKCGYKHHVELCHIKAVSSFPPETLLKTVNSKMNVIQLCRNCHWELDNNYLKVRINNEGFPEFED